jgi:hypothetical protein
MCGIRLSSRPTADSNAATLLRIRKMMASSATSTMKLMNSMRIAGQSQANSILRM